VSQRVKLLLITACEFDDNFLWQINKSVDCIDVCFCGKKRFAVEFIQQKPQGGIHTKMSTSFPQDNFVEKENCASIGRFSYQMVEN